MGNKLREKRLAAGISTYELAKKVEMYQSAISKVENSNRELKAIEAIKIAKALNTTVEELFL